MLWLITPLMGALRNFSKYKDFKFYFYKNPIIYFFLYLIFKQKIFGRS